MVSFIKITFSYFRIIRIWIVCAAVHQDESQKPVQLETCELTMRWKITPSKMLRLKTQVESHYPSSVWLNDQATDVAAVFAINWHVSYLNAFSSQISIFLRFDTKIYDGKYYKWLCIICWRLKMTKNESLEKWEMKPKRQPSNDIAMKLTENQYRCGKWEGDYNALHLDDIFYQTSILTVTFWFFGSAMPKRIARKS